MLETISRPIVPQHLVIAMADHFEPCFTEIPFSFPPIAEQIRRTRDWCNKYPAAVDKWRDAEGHAFKHTYFYPAEHYDPEVVGILAEHCHQGWGEVEIHLHHGLGSPDTPENTREILERFRTQLVAHTCLSRLDSNPKPRYAFVHGNWALANSGSGRNCGVDEEMQILADTGCYADFTLPSAPDATQVAKVNSIYECGRPMNRRAPHRHGRDLRVGVHPTVLPLIFQGPLMLDFGEGRRRVIPRIENSEIASWNPPNLRRVQLWRRAAISVKGRPEWCFVKLHCHGMDPDQESAIIGRQMTDFLQELIATSRDTNEFQVHFVTAREMVNIALAACNGEKGNPARFRNYRIKLLRAFA